MKQLKTLFSAIGLFILISISGCSQNNLNQLRLPALISDNMVLQQEATVKIWGWANQGESIEVTPSWSDPIYIGANDRGDWITDVKTPSAGGPYQLTITGTDSTIIINNIMIGEVWICSGQSNMEMPLTGWPPNDLIDNSEQTIANANYPNLRLFTVSRALSPTELEDTQGEWSECTPENVATFSATAFFFGKEIQKNLDVPVGLIHSSWGGTPAEAWTGAKHLIQLPEYNQFASNLNEIIKSQEIYNSWLDSLKKIVIDDVKNPTNFVDIDLNDVQFSSKDIDDSNWREMELPTFWEKTNIGNFDGVIWFRKIIEIPEDWNNNELVLEIGPIDDMDAAYINGQKIGGIEKPGNWQTPRIYNIPPDKLENGKNIIAIRVIDTQGGGGIYGKRAEMNIYPAKNKNEAISLAGTWKYLPVAEFFNGALYLYDSEKDSYSTRPSFALSINQHTPTMLYNAMIAPLIPFTIKGAIWYQGEANVGRSEQYAKLFPTMITSWRDEWNQGNFPFYYVQIAPYNYSTPAGEESAFLRDAQFRSLSTPNTGMAVTLDIGNPNNIHPSNKPDVGKRLALLALANTYMQKNLVSSGPIYKSMEIEGNKIIITFDSVGSGLKGKELKSFTISGANKEFVKAKAIVKGNTVVVSSSKIKKPVAVRYAWANVPEVTLFNKEGLPASTFRTDNWPE